MSMPNEARIEPSSDDPARSAHRAKFPADYADRFDDRETETHVGMIRELSEERPVRLVATPVDPADPSGGSWIIRVVGYDAFQFLSTLCGLLAVHGLAIREARIYTSRPGAAGPVSSPSRPPLRAAGPGPRRPGRESTAPRSRPVERRVVVDTFRVEAATPAQPAVGWDAIERELTELTQLLRLGHPERAQHRLVRRFVAALERLGPAPALGSTDPVDLSIDPGADPDATLVRVVGPDAFGFLTLTAMALSLCGLRIVKADVKTLDNRRADDLLWITDRAGRKLEDPLKLRSLRSTIILIEHFSRRLPQASDPESALVHFSRFAAETMTRPDWDARFAALDRPEVLDALVRVLGESRFLWEDYLLSQPENVLPMVNDPGEWRRPRGKPNLARDLQAALAGAPRGSPRTIALQRFRDREIFRTDVRTILGLTGGLEGFSAELTDVAEVLAPAAFALAVEQLGDRVPVRPDGRPVPAALLALGKFGGRELGFASDLEMMLVYDDREVADAAGWSGAAEYFDRLVAGIKVVFGARQGSTFDLDFRLRPYGKSGAPATAYSSFAAYFRPDGAAWPYERQALIKLRPVGGDAALGEQLAELRDGFVYRGRGLDPEALRRIRDMQVKQLSRPGEFNAKFSPGALVEAEYIVQALQVARGRLDPEVRSTNTLQALAALERGGHLDPETARDLRQGYVFFRSLVSALRVVHGHAKDLAVPPIDSEDFALLTRRLRRSDPARLQAEIVDQARQVRAVWARLDRLIGKPEP